MSSRIEWTQETWNPVVGCTHCSPGCDHCYAERMARRLQVMGITKYQNVVNEKGWTGKITFDENELKKPLKRKKPTLYFACSMSDLFHENIHTVFIQKILFKIEKCKQHHFIILTKRPNRMKEEMERWCFGCDHGIQNNLSVGVTVCNQTEADEKIPILLQIPAAMRFISIEPMLGPVDLKPILNLWCQKCGCDEHASEDFWKCGQCGKKIPEVPTTRYKDRLGDEYDRAAIDWVICGGETGSGARPLHPDWVRGVRDQCKAAGVPFFFKQWGEYQPIDIRMMSRIPPHTIVTPKGEYFDYTPQTGLECDGDEASMVKVGKKAVGHLLDGVEYREVPDVLKPFSKPMKIEQ